MRIGQIMFVRGNSWISKIINRVDGEFSHVAVVLSDSTVLESQRFAESRIIKNYHEDYKLLDLTLDDYQEDKILNSALKLIGVDYDYKQVAHVIFSGMFKIPRFNDRNKFICSELVVELLYDIGYLNSDEHDSLVDSTPNELYNFLASKESTQ